MNSQAQSEYAAAMSALQLAAERLRRVAPALSLKASGLAQQVELKSKVKFEEK